MVLETGTSTDMATISGEDAESAISFVKKPETTQFGHLYDAHQEPYMTTAYPKKITDMNAVSDKSSKKDKIIELQEYLSNPDELLHSFIGDNDIDVNGELDEKTLNVIDKLEDELEQLLETASIKGTVAYSSTSDIKKALKTASQYRFHKQAKITAKDDRMFKLAKIIIEGK